MTRIARFAAAAAATALLLAPAEPGRTARILFQAWPSVDANSGTEGFDGDPIATRFPAPLPGARDPGDYDPSDPGSVGGDPVSVVSWNQLLGAIGQGSVPTALDFGGDASVWLPDPTALAGCDSDGGLTLCWD